MRVGILLSLLPSAEAYGGPNVMYIPWVTEKTSWASKTYGTAVLMP